MTTNNKEYQYNYMINYRKNSKKIVCDECNLSYKLVYKFKHLQSKKHKLIINFKQNFNNLSNII